MSHISTETDTSSFVDCEQSDDSSISVIHATTFSIFVAPPPHGLSRDRYRTDTKLNETLEE